MESSTKVVLRIIFHLSNQIDSILVIKMTVTLHVFVAYSPNREGFRPKVGADDQLSEGIKPLSRDRGGIYRPSGSENSTARAETFNAVRAGRDGSADLRAATRAETHKTRCSRRMGAIHKGCPAVTRLETLVPCAKSIKAATVTIRPILMGHRL